MDFSQGLLKILPNRGVRFVFNDDVDPATFEASRPGGEAQSLSQLPEKTVLYGPGSWRPDF